MGPVSVPKTQNICLQPEFRSVPAMSFTSFYHPRESHNHLLSPQETLQGQQVGLSQAPIESLLFPWDPVYTGPCVHPPRVESLFPPVLWSSCSQALLAFKAKCFGVLFSQCQTPRLGSLAWCQRCHFCGRTSVIQLFASLCITHLGGMGFDYLACVPLLPSHGFFFMSLDVEYLFFFVDSSLFYQWFFSI